MDLAGVDLGDAPTVDVETRGDAVLEPPFAEQLVDPYGVLEGEVPGGHAGIVSHVGLRVYPKNFGLDHGGVS